jgi:hypothetical protein
MANIGDILNTSRKELLDLSTRNRLLSIPIDSKAARIVQVRDELSEQVFRLLVTEKKTFSFLPGRPSTAKNAPDVMFADGDEASDISDLPQPDDEIDPATKLPKRYVDSKLQTDFTPEGLQRRLLDLYHDAKAMIEEQGVNILYLGLGQLKWYEADQADTPRYAPLILIPVELSRKTATERFILNWTGDDIEENLSLGNKLKQDFDIELPPFPDEEDFDLAGYVEALSKRISAAKNWEVLPNKIVLGFFSFAKFLMFRDLDSKNWPNPDNLLNQPLITGLLQDGFPQKDLLFPDDAYLDDLIPVSNLDHVVDADSTQTQAIESVRKGASLVIQGPPGTGKSQSITNIISTAVLDGKKVLFVAEKLAALEVVKRRLEKEGLGALCLELHSSKSNKRTVIEEIGKTWKLGRPKAADLETLIPKLEQKRNLLNKHVADLHQRHEPAGLTPFIVIGYLSALHNRGMQAGQRMFDGAEKWTADQYRSNRNVLEELAQRIEQIGLPSKHVWHGVCVEVVLQIDLEPLAKQTSQVVDDLVKIRGLCQTLATKLEQPTPKTPAEVAEQIVIAGFVAQAPPLDKATICNEIWNSGLESLRDLLAEGLKFASVCKTTEGKVVDAIWEKDLTEARTQIAAHGQSLLRIFNSKYRAAMAAVRGGLKSELPKTYAERLAFIDSIIEGQSSLRKIQSAESAGIAAFGTSWRKEKSNWKQLGMVIDWVAHQTEVGLSGSFRSMFADVQDQAAIGTLVERLTAQQDKLLNAIKALFAKLSFNHQAGFGEVELEHINLESLNDRLNQWKANTSQLPAWANYYVRSHHARISGFGCLLDVLEIGEVPTKDAVDCFDRIYFTQLLRDIVRQKPNLAQFDGELHEKYVAEFKDLDIERLTLAKYRTLMAHYGRMPQGNVGIGAAGIVRSEMERRRGHRTVRRLLKDAGPVVQAIKPVFMMSPLSIAQFLEPGAVEFDLLVIDEASQVQPVDALGAVARCKQIVVVGDSKQLPPTKFFARLTSDIDDDEDEDAEPTIAQAQDIESILGLCRARGLPEKMLRWHYRSRHHSLIAVSNHEFYDDKLFIVPSPNSKVPDLGLKFNFVEKGVFDSGASGTNRVEAKLVCQAIVEHAQKYPNLTLGVAAFSVRQREAINDELELLRRANPQIESFFAAHPTEPFFVKNLENVQGDERDVIFISVGYGKNASGYMAMRFGPLGMDGGERRLNVLISRAKKRCHVFTSITADDIVLERARGRGVAALKTFLHYAQTGILPIATNTGLEEDSPFEVSVRKAIQALGYIVDPQVGQAGFFIDLGVRDPQQEGRYLLGIECDGATYHSARSARDRDRLRQAVLEDHGWIIHRVWSTDWFQRPDDQIKKIAVALEKAKLGKNIKQQPPAKPAEVEPDAIKREQSPDMDQNLMEKLSVPYIEAKFTVPHRVAPHEVAIRDLAEIVFQIIQIEGPIYENEVVNRVRNLWGFARAGNRIQGAVAASINSLVASSRVTSDQRFLFISGAKISVRNREITASADLRKPDMIAPSEIQAAILAVIDAGHGAARSEIPVAAARMFGFKNTSQQLRYAIESQIFKLGQQKRVAEANGMLQRV